MPTDGLVRPRHPPTRPGPYAVELLPPPGRLPTCGLQCGLGVLPRQPVLPRELHLLQEGQHLCPVPTDGLMRSRHPTTRPDPYAVELLPPPGQLPPRSHHCYNHSSRRRQPPNSCADTGTC